MERKVCPNCGADDAIGGTVTVSWSPSKGAFDAPVDPIPDELECSRCDHVWIDGFEDDEGEAV